MGRRAEIALGILLAVLGAGMAAADWARFQMRKPGEPWSLP